MSISWLIFTKSLRQNWKRLCIIVFTVALGVGMLLSFSSVINGLNARSSRTEWKTAIKNAMKGASLPVNGADPLIARLLYSTSGNLNMWQDQWINVTSLFSTGSTSLQFEGMPTPDAGEYYVSPAVEAIMQENPSIDLGIRFGTKKIGLLPSEYLASPNSLEVVRGMSETEAYGFMNAQVSAVIYSLDTGNGNSYLFSGTLFFVFLIGAGILLFPIVMLLIIASQLGAAQREQRYAALRLIGATRSQITQIIAFESLIASFAGILLGSLGYFLARQPLSRMSFNGMQFWPEDLKINWVQFAVVFALTILSSQFTSWWGMRHVQISPLGVSRRQKLGGRPKATAIIPLILGLVLFIGGWIFIPKDSASQGMLALLLIAIIVITVGIVVAGPWLTYQLARLFSKTTRNATVLLATKRITAQPGQIFLSVSGVIIALFAGSFYLTAVSGVGDLYARIVSSDGYSKLKPDTAIITGDYVSTDLGEQLKSQPYITESVATKSYMGVYSIMLCKDLVRFTTLTCPVNAEAGYAGINFYNTTPQNFIFGSDERDLIAKIDAANPTGVGNIRNELMMKLKDKLAIERLRSLVVSHTKNIMEYDYVVSGAVSKDANSHIDPVITELVTITYIGILVTMIVAIISLVISTIGGILARRRSLTTLHLGGMDLSQLKRMVIFESLVPMISAAIGAAALGVFIGFLFMQTVSRRLDAKLSPIYLVVLIGSLATATLAIYLILPMIKSVTSMEKNQSE